MIVDFHTHAFPAALAGRAVRTLKKVGGALSAYTDGTVDGARAAAAACGIDAMVLLAIATKPSQQTKINNWAAGEASERVIPFGSVHPDAPDALEELDRLAALGLKGIKLHPDYQHFFVDDERVLPIYERAGQLGLITVFHAGCDIGYPDPVHCTPERLKRVLPAFGGAPVVAAHFGGYMMHRETLEHLAGSEVYLDTSYSWSHVPPVTARRIIEAHGFEKVLFGSDAPWGPPEREVAFVRSLGLKQEQENAILGRNAARLLRIGIDEG